MLKKLINKIINKAYDRHMEKLEEQYGMQLPADKYHAKGLEDYDEGRYAEAMEMFKKEIEHDINGHIGYKWMGKAMLKIGNREGAIWHYEVAIEHMQGRNRMYPDPYNLVTINQLKNDLKEIKKGANSV